MGRTLISTLILVLCLSAVPAHSQYHSQSQVYPPKAKKVTKLHFFLHETTGGSDPTAVVVARANASSSNTISQLPFGTVFAIDDPLKVGPQNNSEVIGNAQGLTVAASKNGQTVVMNLDFGFTMGKFNGSSISIFSRNQLTDTVRELAVVGGRGKFRSAKGLALLRVYSITATSLIAEVNVTVIH